MTLRWLEGFENATTIMDVHGRVYTDDTGVFTQVGGAADPVGGNAVSSDDAQLTTPVLVSPTQNSWILQFAFRGANADTINNGALPFISLRNTDGEQCRLEVLQANDTNGKPGGYYFKWRLVRGSTTLVTGTDLFHYAVDGEWIYFEFKITVSNASGTLDGRFRHINKPSLNASGSPTTMSWDGATTGLDTQEQTSTGADRVQVSWNTGNLNDAVAFDDLIIMDSAGTVNNDWLGKVIIEGQKPSGDGTTTNWTLAAATSTEDAWNEPLTSIEDDKRLTSDTTSQVHLCTVGATDKIQGGTIVGVRQDIHCRMETTADLDIGHRYRKTTGTPAETTAGVDLNVDSTTMEASAHVTEADPNTGVAWDFDDLASYEHGVINNG